MNLALLAAANVEVRHVPELPGTSAYESEEHPRTLFVSTRAWLALKNPDELIAYDWDRLVQKQTGGI
jgi:hypothetical protein